MTTSKHAIVKAKRAKKKAPQDLTLRNLRALRKDLRALAVRVWALERLAESD